MNDDITRITRRTAQSLFPDTPPRPPYDPELSESAAVFTTAFPRAALVGIDVVRNFAEAVQSRVEKPDLTVGGTVTVSQHVSPSPDGAPDVELTVFRPRKADRPLPVIYYIHGGGMTAGDALVGIDLALPFVAEGLAVAVSVEYRLAPENPHPAPINDCYTGLRWTFEHAEELGVDADRIMVMGASAGGGLAASLALRARDEGGPALTHQILIYPMLDDRLQTPSSRMVADDGPWDRLDNLWGWTALLGEDRGAPGVSPYAAASRAENLAGLPRTFIDVGSAEVFRDEVLDYAAKLSQSGVSVDLHMWGGAFHGFDLGVPHAAVSRSAVEARTTFVRRALTEQ